MGTQKRDFFANDPLFKAATKWERRYAQKLETVTKFGSVSFARRCYLDDDDIRDRAFEISPNDEDKHQNIERIEVVFSST